MVDLNELKSRIESFFATADEKKDDESYRKVAALLSEYAGRMRIHAVEATKDLIGPVIHKLQSSQEIDAQEKELVRLWVMGSADDFGRQEKCAEELVRLRREMDACWREIDDPVAVARLGNLFDEITRVIYALSASLERKAQTQRFENTLQQMSIEEREFLIEMLKNKSKQTGTW